MQVFSEFVLMFSTGLVLELFLFPFVAYNKMGWEGMDWIHLAQKRGQWRALMNTMLNPQVP
jgi:hypothetical protein